MDSVLLPPNPSARRVVELALTPDPEALRRALGYPSGEGPPPGLAGEIERIVGDAWGHLEPRGVYAVFPVAARSRSSLALGGGVLAGPIAAFLDGAARVAVFVVTVGDGVSRLAARACEAGDPFAGWVLDALGSWAAEATTGALVQHLRGALAPGEGLTPRFSPGYCGMTLEQQRVLFALVEPGAIGVSLTGSCLMRPEKSVSGCVGIGTGDLEALGRTPCAVCRDAACPMRRARPP